MRTWTGVASLVAVLTAGAIAQTNEAWIRPTPAVRIVGNLYWVGTYDLSSYLVATDAGHILINTGLGDSAPLIRKSVESLGFKIADVRILLTTHAHGDHVAAMAALKKMTGARLLVHEGDAGIMEDGGMSDFRFGGSKPSFEPAHVDQRLKDGDDIRMGSAVLRLHHHPGHTRGASSFTLTVREGGRDYRVLIANMPSINPGVKLSGMPGYPTIGADYARTFERLKAIDFDIWLASHASQFGLHMKAPAGTPYDPARFVDPAGYRAALDRLERLYREQVAAESK
jgi:metallo-beta-lactamase class B